MEIIRVDESNIESEHICCAIGNDKENTARARTKKDWMKERFAEGLVFKRLNERGKVFIEYMPMEKAWKPVGGSNYMMIHCLWVSGKFKGQGISKQLLDECIKDAKKLSMDGVAVVSGDKVKPFLTDKKFFLKQGFVTVDTAPPYFELLALKWNKNAKDPVFTGNAKSGSCMTPKGITFIYSNQCPFMEEYVGLLSRISAKKGLICKTVKLQNAEDVRRMGSPFGTLGIYYNGKFQNHELMPESKFEKYLDTLTQ